jgi:large subunit ribosomal protein L3
MTGLIGIKGEACQVYDESGVVWSSTVIAVNDCIVVAKRTKEANGYEALQLGVGAPSRNKQNKPIAGHFKKAGVEQRRFLREVKSDDAAKYKVGDKLTVDIFQAGDKVAVTGTTKGRGFAGGVRRWGWKGGPATHGSMTHRRIGSIGSGTSPGRILPGRTMPGHYGVERVTTRNLKVVRVEPDKGLLYVHGAVPGHRGSLVMVRKG